MSKIKLKKEDVGKFVQVEYDDTGIKCGILVDNSTEYKEDWVTVFFLDSRTCEKPYRDQIVKVGKYVQWRDRNDC